jgi:hypothetical protein
VTEEEIQTRVALVSLLPVRSDVRYQQERECIAMLIGVAPLAAGRQALAWWGEERRHPNHALLPTVLRGICTREPEQALQILEALDEGSRRSTLKGWLPALAYPVDTRMLLALLRYFATLEWQPRDNAVRMLEEVFDYVRFLEPTERREIGEALLAAIEAVPEVSRGQALAECIRNRG